MIFNPNAIPLPNPEIISRRLEGEAVLVLPQRGQVKVLNELGSRIWSLIDGNRSINQIIAVIHQEFTISLEAAAADTTEFLAQLAERDMITFFTP